MASQRPAPPARLLAAHLYWITPDMPPAELRRLAGSVLGSGVDVVQLRHKSLARGELLQLARWLAPECRRAGALFVVNDYLDIAQLADADGVHLGPDDIPIPQARRLGGGSFLIGASASTPDAAAAAVDAGADYLGVGPVFATPLKPQKQAIGAEGVLAVMAAVDAPVFAIGGIAPDNIEQVRVAGIRRACVIRALSEAADPARAASLMRSVLAS